MWFLSERKRGIIHLQILLIDGNDGRMEILLAYFYFSIKAF